MDFESIKSIVVVGSAGAGKSTLVDSLRGPEFQPYLVIPNRFITRAPREGDNEIENIHVSHTQFAGLLAAGDIHPHWRRELGDVERYGFARREHDDRLRIYSANNAFLRDPNETVREVLESSLVVVAMASESVRRERLVLRSPDMSESERELRLNDNGRDVFDTGLTSRVIYTDKLAPEVAQEEMRGVARMALAMESQPA